MNNKCPNSIPPGSSVHPLTLLTCASHRLLRDTLSGLETFRQQAIGVHVRPSRSFYGRAIGAIWKGHGRSHRLSIIKIVYE